jgi:hypothetical protein
MTPLRSFLLLIGVLGLTTVTPVLPSWAQAQEPQPQMTAETRALFTPTVKEYGRPGYPRMTIYVWGNADSGVWNVERGTDLLEFISVVSRARMTDNSPDRRRVEKLSIYRNQQPGGTPFYETEMKDIFSDRQSYPALQEGDILVLETRTRGRFTWRDIARVTGTVAAILNTYLLFDRLGNN